MSEIALCIDTSSGSGSLSVYRVSKEAVLLGSSSWHRVHSHSESLNVEFLKLFKSLGLSIADMDHVVVTHGPGSFTGIRVGLNFAKALAYGLRKPIYTIDSLTATAYMKKTSPLPVLVINNAHKNMLYAATYKTQPFEVVQSPCAIELQDVESLLTEDNYICIGDGFELYKDFLTPTALKKLSPEALNSTNLSQTLGEFWYDNRKKITALHWNEALPLYIRHSEAEEKLWKGART